MGYTASEPPDWLRTARDQWDNTGKTRPSFAIEPADGQESVWDYPRPPALVIDSRLVTVGADADPIARTTNACRVLETASPPTFYIPLGDIDLGRLIVVDGTSMCEWKGAARYWATAKDLSKPIGWDYPDPFQPFEAIGNHMAFYPGRIRCVVDSEVVRPQAGGFYGGWITDEVVGPFKGDPGTGGW